MAAHPSLGIILDFMRHVLCGNNEEQYAYLVDWLAKIASDDRVPESTCIAFVGERSIKVGLFINLLSRMFQPSKAVIELLVQTHTVPGFNASTPPALLYLDSASYDDDSGGPSGLATLAMGILDRYQVPMVIAASNTYAEMLHTTGCDRFAFIHTSPPCGDEDRYWDSVIQCIQQPDTAAQLRTFLCARRSTTLHHQNGR